MSKIERETNRTSLLIISECSGSHSTEDARRVEVSSLEVLSSLLVSSLFKLF